jgi:hypothetical protein
VTCSQVCRELLEHFAFSDQLGPRSGPHLAHLESCADCREEVGLDRELVRQLRRALRARVDGSAPSQASWEHVRRRTVDRPEQPWTVRVLRWGGMASAAAVGVLMFAVATTSQAGLSQGTDSPVFDTASARRAVPPVDEGSPASYTYWALQADAPLPGWPMATQMLQAGARSPDDPPITGRMR